MATVQDVIEAIAEKLRQVPGLRAAPDYPPEQINVYPFAATFLREGTIEAFPGGGTKQLHIVTIEIHVARKDLELDVQALMALYDEVIDKLFEDVTFGGTASTFGILRYTFGGMKWGGVDTIGFRFGLEGLKVLTTG